MKLGTKPLRGNAMPFTEEQAHDEANGARANKDCNGQIPFDRKSPIQAVTSTNSHATPESCWARFPHGLLEFCMIAWSYALFRSCTRSVNRNG